MNLNAHLIETFSCSKSSTVGLVVYAYNSQHLDVCSGRNLTIHPPREFIVAIDEARVRFTDDAFFFFDLVLREDCGSVTVIFFVPVWNKRKGKLQ